MAVAATLKRTRETFEKGIKKTLETKVKKELKRGKICFYDTETTSIHPKSGGRICEFAGLMVENGVPKKTIHLYFNPDAKSWSGALQAHGLSDAFLRTQAPFFKVADKVQNFLTEGALRCAHNGKQFDDNYVNFELRRASLVEAFKKIISPPKGAAILIKKGNAKLRKHKLTAKKITNIDQEANYMASAAVLYFFRDYLSKEVIRNKPGPMMFRDTVLPNQETHPENYEAALLRLAYFRLIRIETNTQEQRNKFKQPVPKAIRDAVERSLKYIHFVKDIFESNVLVEETFSKDRLDPELMFDTYIFAKDNTDVYARNVTIDNLKLDGLLDYYGINRHDREMKGHGAGIDTMLLCEMVKRMFGFEKPAKIQFKKNCLLEFDKNGKVIKEELLHDDKIKE